MIERPGSGALIVEVTDSATPRYHAEELRPQRVAAVALTPGFLRLETVLDHFGVTEANWRDGVAKWPAPAARTPRGAWPPITGSPTSAAPSQSGGRTPATLSGGKTA